MAYFMHKGLPKGQKEYFIDTDSDVASLPTSTSTGEKAAKGSMAISIASGNLFILNSSDQWTKVGG